uniref:Uncharacterized protein n=1 Tax=Oryza rufipogon TaxID=4529 RepID=A0A0E0NJE7_ORYRU
MPDGSPAELHDAGMQRPCAGVDREAQACAGVAGGWKARTTRASTGRGGRGGGRRRDGGRRWAVGTKVKLPALNRARAEGRWCSPTLVHGAVHFLSSILSRSSSSTT